MMKAYENVWRTNYESWAVLVWALCLGWIGYLWGGDVIPDRLALLLAGGGAFMLTRKAIPAWSRWESWINLGGRGLCFITYPELMVRARKKKNSFWLGWGFEWTREHTQRLYDLMRAEKSHAEPPGWFVWVWEAVTGRRMGRGHEARGRPWIHGIGMADEGDIHIPIEHWSGNTLVVGATGCGKTRMLELIAQMAVAEGFTLLVIDPKGDQGFEKSIRNAARAAGRDKDFVRFHLGFPRDSVRIDMLRNFTNLSDIASRIAALMGGSEDNAPFRDYAFKTLNAIVVGLDFVGEKATLVKLRSHVDNGVGDLLHRAILKYFDAKLPKNWEASVGDWIRTTAKRTGKGKKGEGDDVEVAPRQAVGLLLRYYSEELAPAGHWCEAIDSLAGLHTHDAKHHAAMITSLEPVLAKLTTGELGALLSPDVRDIHDPRAITDNQALIKSKSIVYIGLDSLANKTISSAVGSLYLSDLTSVAASIYNYSENPGANKIFLIIDEASEVLNDPFVQLANKARGSGFVLITATQTIADIAARFGSKDKANQLLGNFNNLISMRVIGEETQAYAVEAFGGAFVRSKETTFSNNTNTMSSVAHFAGGVSEKVAETEEDMLPRYLMGELPNWQYVATFGGGRKIKGCVPIISYR